MSRLSFKAEGAGPQSLVPHQDADQVRVRMYLDDRASILLLIRLSGFDQALDVLARQLHRPDFWSAVAVSAILDQVLPARATASLPDVDEHQPVVIEAVVGLVELQLQNEHLPKFGDGVLLYTCEDPLVSA